ncbi:hypothetical protein ACFVHW_37015 [Streptomyces sp. NPDC127110]|uniref:hypothetical protein n=1 Tax=Streptomyces sp. NPDC127110 TaxID=3345362 RepID=UPI00362D9046
MSRTLRKADHETRPFLEIRVRGLHLTVERLPHRLLTAISTLGGAVAGALWYAR